MLIELAGVSKSFETNAGPRTIVSNVNLEIGSGEAVSLVGQNGVGKSTLAAIVAGIDVDYSGTVQRSSEIGKRSPILFQDYRSSLLPWLSIRDNITFPLALRGMSKTLRRKACDELLAWVPMRIDLNTPTRKLSGGQAQLLCILRTLVVFPKLIVCDEPFSAIDYQARLVLRDVLSRICKERNIGLLFISHSLEDAVLLADRVVIMMGQPATLTANIAIATPRPRPDTWLESAEAARIRSSLRESLSTGLRSI